ncbi:F-box/kelch-repeat protein At3g06240-like [Lycium barbarum]|uniref:F-box/kelch-repeat protein At3g06240-like n=1 Tax=Lycium barbarum TaxID=112863 RepID=UPI00293EB839|nr:F-box/kelch-repeat protein At3g06240-like [Lycium barbarum]
MSDDLPEEVLIEVLLRLPTKSIIQWYSLLTSSNFISIHLNNNQDDYLLVRHNSGEPEKEIYALFCDNENFDEYVEFDFPFECGRLNIVGSCNGLLCFSDDYRIGGFRDLFYLWNPSIRKSFQLPQPIFTLETRGPRGFDHTHGFGFDRVTNDYKVVRIVPTNEVPPHVELHKLSTGVWQDITHVSPHLEFLVRIPGVYVNGACHWVASGRQNMIVLFDVHEEKFSDIMAPDSLVNKSLGSFGGGCLILLLGFKFTLFGGCLHGGDGIIDIWLMKEYGEAESWMKQFRIKLSHITYPVDVVDVFFSPLSFLERPIASRKNGEILWRADEGLLVSYDPATEKIKESWHS